MNRLDLIVEINACLTLREKLAFTDPVRAKLATHLQALMKDLDRALDAEQPVGAPPKAPKRKPTV